MTQDPKPHKKEAARREVSRKNWEKLTGNDSEFVTWIGEKPCKFQRLTGEEFEATRERIHCHQLVGDEYEGGRMLVNLQETDARFRTTMVLDFYPNGKEEPHYILVVTGWLPNPVIRIPELADTLWDIAATGATCENVSRALRAKGRTLLTGYVDGAELADSMDAEMEKLSNLAHGLRDRLQHLDQLWGAIPDSALIWFGRFEEKECHDQHSA